MGTLEKSFISTAKQTYTLFQGSFRSSTPKFLDDAHCQGKEATPPPPIPPQSCDWLEYTSCYQLSGMVLFDLVRATFFVSVFTKQGFRTTNAVFLVNTPNRPLAHHDETFAVFDKKVCRIRISDCTFNRKLFAYKISNQVKYQ